MQFVKANRGQPHHHAVRHLLAVREKRIVETRRLAASRGDSLTVTGYKLVLPVSTIFYGQVCRQCVSDIARPTSTYDALPVIKTHLAIARDVPVAGMHVAV